VTQSSYAGLLEFSEAAPSEEEVSEQVERVRTGTVLKHNSTSGHIFVTPDEEGEAIACCPAWACDDWVAMQPGVRVEFEVDLEQQPYQLSSEATEHGGARAGDTVQPALAVRILEAANAMPLQQVLQQVEAFLEHHRRLKRLHFKASRNAG
jgi:cold shock CspA family protein